MFEVLHKILILMHVVPFQYWQHSHSLEKKEDIANIKYKHFCVLQFLRKI